MGFFDRYPAFYETSQTGASPQRLNARHEVLIEGNRDVIEGRRIMDIASHDGRWSFAALCAGARHVTGIEARPHLVDRAIENMRRAGIQEERYRFINGDAHATLATFAPDEFDTVICFGFLYHTLEQMALLQSIARLRPQHLLIDTAVVRSTVALIELREAKTDDEAEAVRREVDGTGTVLVGMPTLAALQLMLTGAGFEYLLDDWLSRERADWSGLEDYQTQNRVSLRAALGGRPTRL